MGNCLVTKLKGVVENDSLPILGYVKLTPLSSDANVYVSYENAQPTKIILQGATFISNGLNYVELAANQRFSFNKRDLNISSPENFSVLLYKYDTIVSLILGGLYIDLAEFSYCTMPNGIIFGSSGSPLGGFNAEISGDLSSLYASIARAADHDNVYLTLSNKTPSTRITGNVTPFTENFKFNQFDLTNIRGITGSLDALGASVNNSGFFIGIACPYSDNVSLNIENFVAIARDAGITSFENFNVKYCGYINTTFNGERQTGNQTNNYLSWTENTITFRDITINA